MIRTRVLSFPKVPVGVINEIDDEDVDEDEDGDGEAYPAALEVCINILPISEKFLRNFKLSQRMAK
jgi:hypothetical protein